MGADRQGRFGNPDTLTETPRRLFSPRWLDSLAVPRVALVDCRCRGGQGVVSGPRDSATSRREGPCDFGMLLLLS